MSDTRTSIKKIVETEKGDEQNEKPTKPQPLDCNRDELKMYILF